jgi:hypothetical protein
MIEGDVHVTLICNNEKHKIMTLPLSTRGRPEPRMFRPGAWEWISIVQAVVLYL